jgi:hypothetical protein
VSNRVERDFSARRDALPEAEPTFEAAVFVIT